MADKSNSDLLNFYKKLGHDPDMEKLIDQNQAEQIRTKDNIIIQSRMAPFLESPFKKINILLKVSDAEGAKRQMNRPENKGRTFEEVLFLSKERLKEEKKRYRNLYNIKNHLDERNFDIVLNTTHLDKALTFQKIYFDIKLMLSL